MDISVPNCNGVLPEGLHDVLARRNRSYAAVNIALCEDGLYRMSVELRYSYGGFSGPIRLDDEGYPSLDAARTAGLRELLEQWPKPFASEPQSVHDELITMRDQVEVRLQQPSLF